MAPVDLYPKGKTQACSITAEGLLSLPQRVLERLGWAAGLELAIRYVPEPLVLLLWPSPSDRPGFKLSYLSRSAGQPRGGKLTCRAFTRQVLQTRILLPKMDLQPVYLHHPPYELALPLEEPAWQSAALTVSGLQAIPSEGIGVYEVLGVNDRVLRIGQGLLGDRLPTHLKDEPLAQSGQQVRYVLLDKPDAVIMEKVRLAQYEEMHGKLPPFNAIHA
jgi:hypothetical protein